MKFSRIVLLLLIAAPSLLRAESSVEQWGVFEFSLNGPTNGNPFTDVSFAARFYQGDSSIEANGFYDGNGMYRVRFMPDKSGEWRFITESSCSELNGRKGEVTVSPPDAENHGPVRVAGTYHFAYADGSPYEELGTTCYGWIHQNEALQEQPSRPSQQRRSTSCGCVFFPSGMIGTPMSL